MHVIRLILVSMLIMLSGSLRAADDYTVTDWEALMPAGWEPSVPEVIEGSDEFEGEFSMTVIEPQQSEAAPIVAELNNRKVRIPGYIIPVKYDGKAVQEFLLVPYVGACIHVPPPPSNQMVYVILAEPLDMASADLWAPVWASGVMKTQQAETEYATAGYTLVQAHTQPYEF